MEKNFISKILQLLHLQKNQFLTTGVLFFVGIIISLFVAEILLRFYGPTVGFGYGHQGLLVEYDPLLGWRKIPNTSVVLSHPEYSIRETTNSQGQRGPEIEYNKDKDTLRVLILGDSFAEGYSVAYTDLFSVILHEKLNGVCSKKVEVINAGTGGYSTDQELLYFEAEGKKYLPDVTVLLFHDNDVWYNAQPRYWRGFKPFYVIRNNLLELTNVPVPRENYLSRVYGWLLRHSFSMKLISGTDNALLRIKSVFTRGTAQLPLDWIGKTPPMPYDEFTVYQNVPSNQVHYAWQLTAKLIERLMESTNTIQSSLLMVYVPPYFRIVQEDWDELLGVYNLDNSSWSNDKVRKTLEGITHGLNVELVDLTPTLLKAQQEAPRELLYYRIDRHWTPAGHRIAALSLYESVLKLLTGCDRPSGDLS